MGRGFFILIFLSIFLPFPSFANQPPSSSPTPMRSIAATIVEVRKDIDPTSDLVVRLHRGDKVEVLEAQNDFAKVRYLIDGEFPVEGWLPNDTLTSETLATDRSSSQPYRPQEKSEVVTKVEKFPKGNLTEPFKPDTTAESATPSTSKNIVTESSQATSGTSDNKPPAPAEETTTSNVFPGWDPVEKPKPTVKAREIPTKRVFEKRDVSSPSKESGSWKWSVTPQLGQTFWEESYRTKDASDLSSDTYYSKDFLRYELSGVYLGIESSIAYDFENFDLGLFLGYRFTFFKGSVPDTSGGIAPSNVQALAHTLEGGPLFRWRHSINNNISLEPEIRGRAQFLIMRANQLQDNSSRQPVLFDLASLNFGVELRPRTRINKKWIIEPYVGATFFNSFTEGPVVSATFDGDKIRTGAPESSDVLFSYGGRVGYEWQYSEQKLIGFYFEAIVRDFSRNYSGLGNRAGIATRDVRATSSALEWSLQAQIPF